MALVAIVALAWLALWVGVVVGSAVSTSRSMPARRLTPGTRTPKVTTTALHNPNPTPDARHPDTKGHGNGHTHPTPTPVAWLLPPDTRLPDTKGHDNSLAQPEPDSCPPAPGSNDRNSGLSSPCSTG